MILYKAALSPYHKNDFVKLQSGYNPFVQQYGLIPENPILLSELLRKMHGAWSNLTPSNRFYVKSLFYQLIHETYQELGKSNSQTFQPDVALMAKQYINEYYGTTILMTDLAKAMGVSTRQLSRTFKEKIGKTPQDYLISKRLEVSLALLHTDYLTLREIALSIGFHDEFYFSRMFKAKYGESPKEYRHKYKENVSDLFMENIFLASYNETHQVSQNELKREGEQDMLKQVKEKAMTAVVLSLMLFLSACNALPANTFETESINSQGDAGQVKEQNSTEKQKGETKIITTQLGDVEIPVNPQRAVVQYLMGDLYALGVIPVGVSQVYEEAAFKEVASKSQDLGFHLDWSPEDVMALNPDIIIVISKEQYKEMSKISPTVYVPYDNNMTIEEHLNFFGEIFDKQEEATKVMEEYHNKIEQAKKELTDANILDKTITIIGGGATNEPYVAGAKYATGALVYNTLGLTAPQKIQKEAIETDEYWLDLSMEVLSQYCGDYIIYLEAEENEIEKELADNEIWNNLSAVKENKVISISANMLWYTDIYTLNTQLDILTTQLRKISSFK